jgi:hypothetical protein
MARFRRLTLGLTLAALLTIGRTAAADPIRITSGFIFIGGVQDPFSRAFLRNISYDFSTESFRLQGIEADGPRQHVFSPTLARASLFTPSGGSGVVVNALSSTLVFNTMPSSAPTPFQMSGTLSIIDRGSFATLFNDAVFGSGTATWSFVLTPSGTSVVSGVDYVFQDVAPTPEPATLALLAAGLGMVAAHRRRANRTG